MTEKRTVVVAAIHNVDTDKFLVSKRPSTGEWEFPGGKIQEDEESGLALLREVREETTLRLTGSLIPVLYLFGCRCTGKSETFTLLLAYVTEWTGVATPQPPETTTLEWRDLEDIEVAGNCAQAHPLAVAALKMHLGR